MGIKLQGFSAQKTADRFTKNDAVGLFLAETTARHMDKYVPADSLTLAQTYITEPFKIIYVQPYARRVFNKEGIFKYSKDKHPLATDRWDKAAQENQADVIAREVTNFVKRQKNL